MWKGKSHTFDPQRELIQMRHLWVLLPDFSLEFGNNATFMAIGNKLECFLCVDSE